jgi:hypothetical protein
MQYCPHFSKKMQSCELSSDGIFLPLKVHVAVFCLTHMYKKCPTFHKYFLSSELEGPDMPAYLPNESEEISGRRRYLRIPAKRSILLSTCDMLGITAGNFVEKAVTVDFSQEGMRLIIGTKIPYDSPFRFHFGSDFIVPRLQGVAQLCWHRPIEDSLKGMEAGMIFKDSFTRAILAFELEY